MRAAMVRSVTLRCTMRACRQQQRYFQVPAVESWRRAFSSPQQLQLQQQQHQQQQQQHRQQQARSGLVVTGVASLLALTAAVWLQQRITHDGDGALRAQPTSNTSSSFPSSSATPPTASTTGSALTDALQAVKAAVTGTSSSSSPSSSSTSSSTPSNAPHNNHHLVHTHSDSLNFDAIDFKDFAIFSGRANPELAQEIADKLGVKLGDISIRGYADGEIGIQVNENVRGKDVYLIQPTCPPGVNDHLVELLLMVSTMRRASARRITAIIPYYGYARQDRKMASRVPISAADVARLLQAMGVDRVVAVDLHCGQIQGFFGPRTPCDNLEAHVVALPFFKDLKLNPETTKVVSPDAGGVYRAKRFRDGLHSQGVDAGLAMIVKQRLKANQIGRMDLVGDVQGCDVIMVDDMIDTAGTLTEAAKELKNMGAKRIFAFATHGVFSGPAYERIANSVLEQVIVCNTVPLREGVNTDKIVQISIAELLAAAIARIHAKKSVSALFQEQRAAASSAVPSINNKP